MTPTPEQIGKLPKWAQDYIKELSRERDNAKGILKRFTDSQTKTNVFVENHGTDMTRCYIQDNCIHFGEREFLVRFDGKMLDVSHRWEALSITPVASNRVQIRKGE